MEKSAVYVCKTCRAVLFSVSDKMGTSSNSIAFKKPLNDNSIQSRKNREGQWLVRCTKCHSHLGSAVGGKAPHYRIQSPSIDLRESDPEVELPEFEKDDNEKDGRNKVSSDAPSQTIDIGTSTMSAAAIFGGGAAVGAIVGATVAFLICRNLETPLSATNLTATSSTLVPPTTSSTTGGTRPTPAPPTPAPRPTPADVAPVSTSSAALESADATF